MISEELNIELGARLRACSCFEWVDGMLAIERRVGPFEDYRIRVQMPHTQPHRNMVPDMADKPTVYAVLDLIEELWQEPGGPHRAVWLEPRAYGWRVRGLRVWNIDRPGPLGIPPKPTRAEAVTAAIEATEGRF